MRRKDRWPLADRGAAGCATTLVPAAMTIPIHPGT
jgi:hypothetical protein